MIHGIGKSTKLKKNHVFQGNTTGHRLKLYMLSNNLEGMHPTHAKTENHCMVRKKYYSEIADISKIIAIFAADNSSGQGEIPDRR